MLVEMLAVAALQDGGDQTALAERRGDAAAALTTCVREASRFTSRLSGTVREAADASIDVCNRERSALREILRRAYPDAQERNAELESDLGVARTFSTLHVVLDRSCERDVACLDFFRSRGVYR